MSGLWMYFQYCLLSPEAADDRAGLERLLRCCSRPAFSGERLSWRVEGERVVYRLPKPRPDGTQQVALTVSELFDRLAALIPPPRRHRHRYLGLLAPVCPKGRMRRCAEPSPRALGKRSSLRLRRRPHRVRTNRPITRAALPPICGQP